MSHRLTSILLASMLLGFAALATAVDDDRDRIYGASTKTDAYVQNELSDITTFKVSAQSALQKKPTKDIKRIVYAGMNVDGVWRKGMESKSRGRYEEAAEFFGQLADSGAKEWEKTYGAMQEGECWELAHKYDLAAKAYQKVVKTADFTKDDKAQPRHRLWLDAAYHFGVANALDKKPDEATKVVEGLSAYAKLQNVPNSSGAETRANAVRAAIAAVAADMGKLREYSQKTNFRPGEEMETWFHFNLLVADVYRTGGKPKDALSIVDRMVDEPALVAEPARKAQAELVKGMCLLETDPQGAVVELLKIDLLPYGSEDQKCEARYNAGRLMLDEAAKIKAKPETAKDDRKADFVKELTRTARMLLGAAADSSSTLPSKSLAKAALDKMEPEEGAAPAEGDPATGATGAPKAKKPPVDRPTGP